MGTRSDVAELLSSCRWSEEGSYLGEIVKSASSNLPQNGKTTTVNDGSFCAVVKVVRGQYQNIGHPSFSNPSLVTNLLLISAGKQRAIAAQCVKFKNQNTRVVVPFGPTLAIPSSFEGHFEILSEDGKSVPVIQSVEGLTRKFPDSCLVREPIKGYKADSPPPPPTNNLKNSHMNNKSSSSNNLSLTNCSNNESLSSSSAAVVPNPLPPIIGPEITPYYRISDKNRIVQSGEVLVLVGEVSVPSSNGKKVTRYLRCFDSKGQTVYLNTSQKGKFSPLARQDSISGVHTTKNLLNKRMPMMVRLVDGKPPVSPFNKSYSSFKKFVPELRLFSTVAEELIFAMPLSQNSKETPHILPLPMSAPLKFQVCSNFAQVEQMKEFCRLQEKMKTMIDAAKNLIQIYDINLKRELRFDGRQWKAYSPPIFFNSSTPLSVASPQHFSSNGNGGGLGGADEEAISTHPNHNYEVPDVQDYEDIDQIYDYVRGVKPLPPSSHLHHQKTVQQHATTKMIISEVSHGHGSKQKLSRSNGIIGRSSGGGGGIVEKKIVASAAQYKLQRTEHAISSSTTATTACIVIKSKDNEEPTKPPRRVTSNSHNMRRSMSVDRLIDDVDDQKPEPPPIETIPTHKNRLAVSTSAKIIQHPRQRKSLADLRDKEYILNDVDDGETGFNNYGDDDEVYEEEDDYYEDDVGDDDGVKVTSGNSTNYYEVTCNKVRNKITARHSPNNAPTINNPLNHFHLSRSHKNNNHYQEISGQHQQASIDDENTKKLLQKQKNTSKVLISSSNESSPNNTGTTTASSSGVSSSSPGCAIIITTSTTANDQNQISSAINNSIDIVDEGDQKGKVKKHHYVKRNSGTKNEITTPANVIASPAPPTTPSGIISGSPSNRIIFRRSPIFDCRYKSMNDLNRNSLESGASGSGSSSGGGGLGSKLSRYFQFPSHQHPQSTQHAHNHYHQFSSPTSKPLGGNGFLLNRNRPHYHSNSNINVNLLNLNIKASSRHKALFRPKSLTNLLEISTPSMRGFGFGKSNGSSCRKKLLENMVVPNHHHAIHSSTPSFDIFNKMTNSSSASSSKRNSCTSSSGGGSRKNCQLPTLYL